MSIRSTAAAALALLAASCSAPQSGAVSLFGVCAFPQPSNGGCSFASGGCGASLAGTAIFDVVDAAANGGAFDLPLQVNNQALSSASTANGTADVDTAYVQSFEITYTGTNIPSATIPVQLTVPSGTDSVFDVVLIPPDRVASLPAVAGAFVDIVLDVKATGVFLSGGSFTTQTLQVPVTLCATSGCLIVGCPAGKTFSGQCGGSFESPTTVTCQ